MLNLSRVAARHIVHVGRLMPITTLQQQAFAAACALRSRPVPAVRPYQTLSVHKYSIPQPFCPHVAAATGGLRAHASASATNMAAETEAGPAAASPLQSEASQPAAPPAAAATDQQMAHDSGAAPPAKPGKRKVAMHVAYIGTAFRGAPSAPRASRVTAEPYTRGIHR
jgi:hypothetical protein